MEQLRHFKNDRRVAEMSKLLAVGVVRSARHREISVFAAADTGVMRISSLTSDAMPCRRLSLADKAVCGKLSGL